MTWPMLVYSAVMLAICITLLRRMFVLPRQEYAKQYRETLERVDRKTVAWYTWFSAAVIVIYFWLAALAVLQIWLFGYAGYKTIDSVISVRRSTSPDLQRYPSPFRKLTTLADFLVIVYVVAVTIFPVKLWR